MLDQVAVSQRRWLYMTPCSCRVADAEETMSDFDLAIAVPGGFDRLTGGTIYDRRLAEGLEAMGARIRRIVLPGGFPDPDTADLGATRAVLSALPTGSRLVIDGLALGVLPELAAELSQRFELVALVHHPLAFETGLDPDRADAQQTSEAAALAAVSRVICTSATTRTALVEDFAVPEAKIIVAPPGTDPKPLATGSDGAGLAILSIGSVTPRKDQRTLVAALAGIDDRRVSAIIAGSLERDPATVQALVELIAETEQDDRIELAGELAAAALDEVFETADLFVSTALYEGYGMAAAEAVAAGIPCLIARGGAITEAVPPSAALFFEPGDVAELRRLIQSLWHDPVALARLRDGAKRARERLPGWDKTARLVAQGLGLEPHR
jgi:glycosyltransferase involved in cell wall biosynthesis